MTNIIRSMRAQPVRTGRFMLSLSGYSVLVVKYKSTVSRPSAILASASCVVCGVGTITGWPGFQFSGVEALCSSDVCSAVTDHTFPEPALS